MSWTLRRILAALGLSAVIAAAVLGWRQMTRPTVLTVAVGPAGYDDALLMAALSRALADDGAAVRLAIRTTSGQQESLDLLRSEKVRLAVIRNEGDAPDNARAVALLHQDPVIVMTPKAAKIDDFFQLAGKTIGLIAAHEAAGAQGGVYHRLIEQLRRHYQGAFKTVEAPPEPEAIAAALKAGRFDAALFVAPTTRDSAIARSTALVRRLTGKAFAFTPIEDAEAIAAAAPYYAAGAIDQGAFGGRPLAPAEDVATLLVSSFLVADQASPTPTIAALTRFIFANRSRLAADAPVAALIRAVDTDRDAFLPAHEGARLFYEGEEPSFLDQYGDWFYIGPMALGGLYSALLGLRRFLGFGRERETGLLAAADEAIASIRRARSLDELDDIAAAVDAEVARLYAQAAQGAIDEKAIGAGGVALRHIGALLREKRDELRAG